MFPSYVREVLNSGERSRLRVFGNLGRRSDPESSILTIFARPRDFSKLPKTHARKGPRFQWLSELLRVPRQRAARLASVRRVDGRTHMSEWTSMLDGELEETSSAILLFAKRVLSEKGK